MSEEIYQQQVELMLKVLPVVEKSTCLALKGGTAINFFIQDMPRLSVDIDLTYTLIEPRNRSLENINNEMLKIADDIRKIFPDLLIGEAKTKDTRRINKLFIRDERCEIKIEPNFILRGSLSPCEIHSLCKSAQEQYAIFAQVKMLSKAEVYAGKICAALDRQHPRDLFDIKILYENGKVTDEIRQAFVVYLASSPRPISEMLNPNLLDIESSFNNEFMGMTMQKVTLEELQDIRQYLITDIRKNLTSNEKEFLISIKKGDPKWDLLPFENLDRLPALQWKLINVQRMDDEKKKRALEKLCGVFGSV